LLLSIFSDFHKKNSNMARRRKTRSQHRAERDNSNLFAAAFPGVAPPQQEPEAAAWAAAAGC
jgi:hypothetical protein